MPGDRVDVDYFVWSDQDGLRTESAAFRFAGVVPMSGAGGDRTLTPEYPGITDASDVTSWDPPFPVDLKRVRKTGRGLLGHVARGAEGVHPARRRSAPVAEPVRLAVVAAVVGTARRLATHATSSMHSTAGLTVRHARAEALAAADGTTDFGEYFVYFSFFLVVAGLLLAGMFFALTRRAAGA